MFLVFPIFGSVSYNDKGLLKVGDLQLKTIFLPEEEEQRNVWQNWQTAQGSHHKHGVR